MENNFLPLEFKEKMKILLGNEYEDFDKSYDKERFAGLRFNPLKTDFDSFMNALPFNVKKVPWADEGFYYDLKDRPGKHPFHEAGAYYIQEPSAMSAVAVLDPKPGDICLDLCAAPGGKSTQIAGRLIGKGLLVSNEIVPNRSLILASNLERMGVRNAVCLNEDAHKLSKRFPSFFTKILVDAPCSGEGMFKKEENATGEWSPEHVEMCARRQAEILEEAAKMLKAGGRLVYSTCTFNPLENESLIYDFLLNHPEFKLEESESEKYFSNGHPEWIVNDEGENGAYERIGTVQGTDIDIDKDIAKSLEHSMRLWPHKLDGEGHFVAKLRKEGTLDNVTDDSYDNYSSTLSKKDQATLKEIKEFLEEVVGVKTDVLSSILSGVIPVTFGENIYLLPAKVGTLSGLKVQRAGLHVAVSKKNRLEPAHALALALKPSDVKVSVTLSEDEARKYIGGQTINTDPEIKGWVLVSAGPFSLGFGKASGGVIKNHYPKGLRIDY